MNNLEKLFRKFFNIGREQQEEQEKQEVPVEKMKVSNLDAGVAELVNLLNENGMRPFASCDGSVKSHMNEYFEIEHDVIAGSGYIGMLDSDKARDLFALLQEDDTYRLSIDKMKEITLYGNKIEGLRYCIYFDNLRGGKAEELTKKVIAYLGGEIAPTEEQRKRIDKIAQTLEGISDENLRLGCSIHEFFKINSDKFDVGENYSFKIRQYQLKKDMTQIDRRKIEDFRQKLSVDSQSVYYSTTDFEQNMRIFKGILQIYDMLPELNEQEIENVKREMAREEMLRRFSEGPLVDEKNREFDRKILRESVKYKDHYREKSVQKSIRRHEKKLTRKNIPQSQDASKGNEDVEI